MVFAKTERSKSTKTSNPVFNGPIKMKLPESVDGELMKCNLNVEVWDRDSFNRESLIGKNLLNVICTLY